MNEFHFNEKLRMIYGTFSKAFPAQHIRDAIFKRVEDLPDAFMDFALKQLENQESLPANLGRHLREELWYDFLRKHPELKAKVTACPECDNPDDPGTFWMLDGDGNYQHFNCACGASHAYKGKKGWTKREAMRAGYTLPQVPFSSQRPLPPDMQAAIGHTERIRPAHQACLDDALGW